MNLQQLNAAPAEEALRLLDGLYEHSPWIAEQALAARPFVSLAHMKHVMTQVVAAAGLDAQLALIRAHPELAGKAMLSQALSAESGHEQQQAGLTQCSATELATLERLNAAYREKFGFPFILAVRGPRATGLARKEIIDTFERRLQGAPAFELAENLRNIHRIAELRLNDKFASTPVLGNQVWDWQEALAQFSDPGYREKGQLTVTYLSAAHQACARSIAATMRGCGFDEVARDAVGNVVGRYRASLADAPSLLTGSHFDTVRNGGKYDGRLGIFVPLACVRELSRRGQRLLFDIEVVAFAEEEGQRYKAAFLGSGALTGDFNERWLEQRDSEQISMREAMQNAGLRVDEIAAIRRNPNNYLGFVEVHIEQGPVLNELNLPLGLVSSINGSVRFAVEITGTACHAGTTPMDRRHDAAAGAAELLLYVEGRAARDGDSVATVGMLQVPGGSINVVPGCCQFSLDLRAPNDRQRDALVDDVLAELSAICARRGLHHTLEETLRVGAAPSAPAWRQRWAAAVTALGVPLHTMPSGAGHDAMKLHAIMGQAMLFVRGQNAGISHSPLECSTSDDMQLAVEAFSALLQQLSADLNNPSEGLAA